MDTFRGARHLRLISRAAAASDDQGRAQSFREFIERALNGSALKAKRLSCHIGLTFESDDGQPVHIERTWHFHDSGRLRSGESAETIRIVQGLTRRVVGPNSSEQDPEGWYRDWISRSFLPTSLAAFFLFDGEAASVYAERDMGVQVREGIEGLLGLTWLRTLADDLRRYAANRRSTVPRGVTSEAIADLEANVVKFESEIGGAEARLKEVAVDLQGAEAEREALTRELAGYGTGTRAQLEELINERADQEKAYQAAQTELFRIAEMDLPLALSGQALRDRLSQRLDRERRREQWLASADNGRDRVEIVVQQIEVDLRTVTPALVPEQGAGVLSSVRRALDRLWHPAPTNIAEAFLHPHARGPMGERIRTRLEQAATVTAGTVSALLEAMARSAAALREVTMTIQATQVTAPQLEEKRRRITELNAKVRSLSEEQGEKFNIISSRKAELEQKRKELGRLTGQLDQSLRPARLAKRAEEVSAMLDDLIEEAWPMQAEVVASAMTDAVQAMAHRSDYLNRVAILADGQVELRAPNGRNLRDFDLSAGEKQIFTQALFSAIAHVSERIFPLVVDTPLGRLDEEHRLNVLRHLAERDGQVILISTNTEVVGPYLDAIRSRVLKAYLIQNSTDGDLGKSWPTEGYFAGQGL